MQNMSERCELSDLLVTECARVKHAPKVLPRTGIVITARFPAHFDSRCDECDSQMHEGEIISRTEDGDFICAGCSTDNPDTKSPDPGPTPAPPRSS